MVLFLPSCIEEPESPQIPDVQTSEISQVRDWFETNKTNLRLPERGSNFRTESQELILPFFEKEPDWDQFHHYYFPDGREVFEVSLDNATKFFPGSMLDSFPDQNPAELMIQNIMFVKHPHELRFDPVIARYYPDDTSAIEEFNTISYDCIPFDWSGTLDIWTYDERHFIGFTFENGDLINNFKYQPSRSGNHARIAGDCREMEREIVISTPGSPEDDPGGYGNTVINISKTYCSGGTGYTPGGGQGTGDNGDYHDYERPPCCDDPVTAPPRDIPTYDPPSIPSPKTIINQLTNQCAIDIFKDLSKGSSGLTDLTGLGSLDIFPGMLDLFENSGKFDYRIQNSDNTGGANAFTKRVNGINVVTISDDYLDNATSLSIARTIIHETVHAYMWEQTKNTSDKNTLNLLNLYWEIYRDSDKSRWPDTHHAAMSNFILGMAVSLYNWDKNHGPTGGTLGFDYYYKSVFAGLVKKDNPTELIEEAEAFLPESTSWNEILIQINNEVSGNNKAKGEKCD